MSDEQAIQAAARLIMKTALDVLYTDPHMWSTRPCPTCEPISALIGTPFGCVRYRVERQRPAQPQGEPR